MNRLSALLLLALLTPAIARATGVFGSDAPTRIPVPAKVFSASVTDASGVTVELTRVTFDGEVFVTGELGEAQVALPFERIVDLRVEPTGEAGTRILWAKLEDGSGARVVVPSDKPLYGEAVFGYYKIEVGDLARVTFAR